jgi:D-glycero-alpha-D-manno-heptose-7-phosphate kinase
MFTTQVKSPTRVDLAGGTLDCWPLYLFLNSPPVTVNVAVDIFTYVELSERPDAKVELHSADLNKRVIYSDLASCLADTEPAFELVRAHLRWWQPQRGFELSTRSESPIGGGLGGSSSLCISLLKAFNEWLGAEMGRQLGAYEMVRIASHLEAQVLLKPTGTQDYFPPIFGGLNFITYGVPGPSVEVSEIPREIFEDRFLLVYTGRTHHSGINNWEVIKHWLDGDSRTRQALQKLADVSAEMRQVLRSNSGTKPNPNQVQNLSLLPQLFEREYAARTELSDGFSSPEIRRLSEMAHSIGANAKICGAGGGGCVLIWCQDRQIDQASELCRREGFTVLPARPFAKVGL